MSFTRSQQAKYRPVVDAAWLKANAADVVVVDLQDPKAFARFHIPGAVNLAYDAWRTQAPKGN